MLILFGIVGLVGLIGALIVLNFGMTWLRARVSGAPVKFIELIALKTSRKFPSGLNRQCPYHSREIGHQCFNRRPFYSLPRRR